MIENSAAAFDHESERRPTQCRYAEMTSIPYGSKKNTSPVVFDKFPK